MKTLNLHCDYINFTALKKALKNIEEIAPGQKMEGESKNVLVVMVAVEKGDSLELVSDLVGSINDIASQVQTKNIVLYPYAHLSSNLGKPSLAVGILQETAKKLKGFKVISAPFGYYKSFELKVKGHPLSELSREIVGEVISGNEEELDLSKSEREKLWKKMSKVKMQAPKGKDGRKSNVEIGRELDLFIVNEVVGSGLPLLTAKGTAIKRELERFTIDEELRRGYEHTSTPVMAKSDLYKVSGHWQHYKKDMFVLDVHGEDYALRPMTCPFQFILFKRKPRTYKDLPKRYAEMASLFRNEQSGELRGLTRVRQFTLADAHIICAPEQVEAEFKGVIDLVNYVMETLGIEVYYRFSKWDSKNKSGKYIDNPRAWEATQKSMKKMLDKLKIDYVEADDEAAFYGPKLDLQYKDVYGKEDTLLTVQVDFANCGNFDLMYTDKDGKEKPAMIIHRAATGATERVMAYLLEKTQGNLPLWLSPVQVRVLSMNEANDDYVLSVRDALLKEGIRVEVDVSNESIGKKARKAITEKVFYLATVGEKEKKENELAIRGRDSKDIENLKVEDFISKLKKEISERVR